MLQESHGDGNRCHKTSTRDGNNDTFSHKAVIPVPPVAKRICQQLFSISVPMKMFNNTPSLIFRNYQRDIFIKCRLTAVTARISFTDS